jgi:aspartyl-tRNA(Asn)/glutamyl-tRNA(Gln) amidotransferase subunit A
MKNILSIKNNLTKENLNQQKENEINEAKKIDDVTFCTMFTGKEYENKNTDGKLFGSFYFSKDNIWTKGYPTTASSKILENFIPAEDATIIKLLNDAGAEMLGKTVLDELGMGGTGLHASTGIVYNPLDRNRIVGGSSSGSVFAMAKGLGHFALGTDTGDSIRKPASLNGVIGYKPTYGSISRYGVIPYAPSMDHVGFFTRSVADLFVLAETTFKHDKKDFTSIDNSDEYTKYINQKTKLKKVGYFGVLKNYRSCINFCQFRWNEFWITCRWNWLWRYYEKNSRRWIWWSCQTTFHYWKLPIKERQPNWIATESKTNQKINCKRIK